MKKILFVLLALFCFSSLARNQAPMQFERTGSNTLRSKCEPVTVNGVTAQCDYNLSGVAYFWSDNGVSYAYGIVTDDFGTRSRSVFHQVGNLYYSFIPYIEDAITNERIMEHGSVAQYLIDTLPGANAYLAARTQAQCPADPTDKRAAAAYDLASGVIAWNGVTKRLELTMQPPFPHANCPQ